MRSRTVLVGHDVQSEYTAVAVTSDSTNGLSAKGPSMDEATEGLLLQLPQLRGISQVQSNSLGIRPTYADGLPKKLVVHSW